MNGADEEPVDGELVGDLTVDDDDAQALDRILEFVQPHGEAYATLCMHAALPLGLTPDLLHIIRYNFVREAPRIAEADLLLSPLCQSVGAGYFQMRSAVRDLLIFDLSSDLDFGKRRVRQIGELLLGYVQHRWRTSHDKETRSFLLAQKWTALAYLDPAAAARQLAQALSGELQGTSDSDVVRIANVAQHLATPLQREDELLLYAAGVEKLASGAVAAAARFFESLGNSGEACRVHDVLLPAPDQLLSSAGARSAKVKDDLHKSLDSGDETANSAAENWPTPDQVSQELMRRGVACLPPKFVDHRVRMEANDKTDSNNGESNTGDSASERPWMHVGGLALLFELTDENGQDSRLVRVFLKNSHELFTKYERLEGKIAALPADTQKYFTPIEFFHEGIQIGGQHYPIVVMPKLDAVPLSKVSSFRSQFPSQWRDLVRKLRQAMLVHGDLQPTNILVDADQNLKLVDYDSVWWNGCGQSELLEIGPAPFRHPELSTEHIVDPETDHLPAISIYVGMLLRFESPDFMALASFANRNFLFGAADLSSSQTSVVASKVLRDTELEPQVAYWELVKLWNGRFYDVPNLEAFISHVARVCELPGATILCREEELSQLERVKIMIATRPDFEVSPKFEVLTDEMSIGPDIRNKVFICWSAAAEKSERYRTLIGSPTWVSSDVRIVVLDDSSPVLPASLANAPVDTVRLANEQEIWPRRPPDLEITNPTVTLETVRLIFDEPDEEKVIGAVERALGTVDNYIAERDLPKIALQFGANQGSWAFVSCTPETHGWVRETLTPALKAFGMPRVFDTSKVLDKSEHTVLQIVQRAKMLIDVRTNPQADLDEWGIFAAHRSHRTVRRIQMYLEGSDPSKPHPVSQINAGLVFEDCRDLRRARPKLEQAVKDCARVPQDVYRNALANPTDCEVADGLLRDQLLDLLSPLNLPIVNEDEIPDVRSIGFKLTQIPVRCALRILLFENGLTFRFVDKGLEIVGIPEQVDASRPVAILSDIRGNLDALDAVLEDIHSRGIDQVINLGDTAGASPFPVECLRLSRGFQANLMGAFDQALLFDPEGMHPDTMKAVFWAREQLESPNLRPELSNKLWDHLGGLPRHYAIKDKAFGPGSPRQPFEKIFPEDIYNVRKMEKLFAMIDHVGFYGNSGVPGVFRDDKFFSPEDGEFEFDLNWEKLIVTVGSVGWPRDGIHDASYVIWQKDRISFQRVPYPWKTTVARMQRIPELENSADFVSGTRDDDEDLESPDDLRLGIDDL